MVNKFIGVHRNSATRHNLFWIWIYYLDVMVFNCNRMQSQSLAGFPFKHLPAEKSAQNNEMFSWWLGTRLNNFEKILNNWNISEIFTDFSKNWILFFKKLKILDIRSMFVKCRQNFIKILTKNRILDLKNANFEWILLNKLFKTAKIVTRFLTQILRSERCKGSQIL